MPRTETTRREYRRDCPRYASDLIDCEWSLIEPFMPPPRRIGRPRKTDLREVVNAPPRPLPGFPHFLSRLPCLPLSCRATTGQTPPQEA